VIEWTTNYSTATNDGNAHARRPVQRVHGCRLMGIPPIRRRLEIAMEDVVARHAAISLSETAARHKARDPGQVPGRQ
jgi:hypothetical protein